MAKSLELSTTDFDRATVRIDGKGYKMRNAEELTFDQFGRQISIAKRMTEIVEGGDVSGKDLKELGALTAEAINIMLISVPKTVVAKITPGLFKKISTFFNQLTSEDADEAEVSENASSSSPGVSDSTAASEAA